jgi:uncharacterized protein (TIGR00255 family)
MIKSMTGFAKVEVEYNEGRINAEARTLNNRYLEIAVKLPKSDFILEQKLRERVKRLLRRGKVDLSIKWERTGEQSNPLKVNGETVQQYLQIEDTLRDMYGIKGHLRLETILGFKDVLSSEESSQVAEEMLLSACESLIGKLNEERAAEGSYIESDLLKRIETIATGIQEIEKRWPEVMTAHEGKLRERVRGVVEAGQVDEVRILQELALYMERLDITEEIVRLKGHLQHFKGTLTLDDAVGRKLDFIIQEMVREVNTIGSKSNDLQINEWVIQVKVEIEKMREQVQNVE